MVRRPALVRLHPAPSCAAAAAAASNVPIPIAVMYRIIAVADNVPLSSNNTLSPERWVHATDDIECE